MSLGDYGVDPYCEVKDEFRYATVNILLQCRSFVTRKYMHDIGNKEIDFEI